MTLTAHEAWSRLLDRARQELPEQTYRTWLEPTEALSMNETTVFVGCPDQFAADWNESKHADMLASLAPIAFGHPLSVVFKVTEERRARSQMDLFIAQPPQRPVQTQNSGINSPPVSDRYTFAHFVIGKSNELAAAAAHAVGQAPGKVYNPLFIYGDTGLGKTHLMQAIAHEILLRKPETRITFIGTEQFTNELVAAIQNRTTADFRRRFRETDLLLVDDVHFLKGKEAMQEEFFHTFNALYEGGRQIVLTSDRPPLEIPGLEARLVSRFQWGMVADIEMPDLEHRIAILRQKAQLDHLELTIPEEVVRFIAENVRSSVRELEGSIIKLLAYASLKHREITVEVAREALRDKLQGASWRTGRRPGAQHLCHSAGRRQRMERHDRGASLEDPNEESHRAASGRDVPHARSAWHAARRNRRRLWWARPLDRHSLPRARFGDEERRSLVRAACWEDPSGVGKSAELNKRPPAIHRMSFSRLLASGVLAFPT